ncbi:unnamed protein product [Chrysoparadoxa australica]
MLNGTKAHIWQEIRERGAECKATLNDWHSDEWCLAQSILGVKTWYKYDKDGSLWIKIQGPMDDLSLMDQLTMIREVDLYKVWMPFCTDSKLLGHINQTELVGFFNIGLPGVSRDVVVRAYACDCLESSCLLLQGKSVEQCEGIDIPEVKATWTHNRMNLRGFNCRIDILSPTSANTSIVANIDLKVRIPESLLNFAMKRAAGMLLVFFVRYGRGISQDQKNQHRLRMREEIDFYRSWVWPKVLHQHQQQGWEAVKPVAFLEEEAAQAGVAETVTELLDTPNTKAKKKRLRLSTKGIGRAILRRGSKDKGKAANAEGDIGLRLDADGREDGRLPVVPMLPDMLLLLAHAPPCSLAQQANPVIIEQFEAWKQDQAQSSPPEPESHLCSFPIALALLLVGFCLLSWLLSSSGILPIGFEIIIRTVSLRFALYTLVRLGWNSLQLRENKVVANGRSGEAGAGKRGAPCPPPHATASRRMFLAAAAKGSTLAAVSVQAVVIAMTSVRVLIPRLWGDHSHCWSTAVSGASSQVDCTLVLLIGAILAVSSHPDGVALMGLALVDAAVPRGRTFQ